VPFPGGSKLSYLSDEMRSRQAQTNAAPNDCSWNTHRLYASERVGFSARDDNNVANSAQAQWRFLGRVDNYPFVANRIVVAQTVFAPKGLNKSAQGNAGNALGKRQVEMLSPERAKQRTP
jgi:hypothetical protein